MTRRPIDPENARYIPMLAAAIASTPCPFCGEPGLPCKSCRGSGMASINAYARHVLVRNNARQLQRWLAGTYPIPESVRDMLERNGP